MSSVRAHEHVVATVCKPLMVPSLQDKVLATVNSSLEFVLQLQILLQCWPDSNTNTDTAPSPPSPVADADVSRLFLATQHSDVHAQAVQQVADVRACLLALKTEHATLSSSWFDASHQAFISRSRSALLDVCQKLDFLVSLTSSAKSDSNWIKAGLEYIRGELQQTCAAVSERQETSSTAATSSPLRDDTPPHQSDDEYSEFLAQLEALVTSSLLAVQDLLKVQPTSQQTADNDDVTDGAVDDEDEALKNILTEKLQTRAKLVASNCRLAEVDGSTLSHECCRT